MRTVIALVAVTMGLAFVSTANAQIRSVSEWRVGAQMRLLRHHHHAGSVKPAGGCLSYLSYQGGGYRPGDQDQLCSGRTRRTRSDESVFRAYRGSKHVPGRCRKGIDRIAALFGWFRRGQRHVRTAHGQVAPHVRDAPASYVWLVLDNGVFLLTLSSHCGCGAAPASAPSRRPSIASFVLISHECACGNQRDAPGPW